MPRDDVLFHKHDMLQVMRATKVQAQKKVDGLDSQLLINASEDEVCEIVFTKVAPVPIVLHEDQMSRKPSKEVKIDVSRDPRRAHFLGDAPIIVAATEYTIVVPFDGDAELFHCKPSTWSSPPRGIVSGQQLLLSYVQENPDTESLKRGIDKDLATVKEYIGWVNDDVDKLHKELRPLIVQSVQARKAKLAQARDVGKDLGIPLEGERE